MIDVLFVRMLTMFGTQWHDRWDGIPLDIVKRDWRKALACYDPETIRLAYESMHREARQFPPNLSEFSALCRQFVRRGAHSLVAIADNRRDPPPQGFQHLRDIIKRTT